MEESCEYCACSPKFAGCGKDMVINMNRLRGSAGAKVAAWIGITISGIVFFGSIIAAYGLLEVGIYEESKRDMKREGFEYVADNYSVMALANMKSGENVDLFADTYFQYGIIQADSLDELDLNDDANYVERNFSQEVTRDDLYIVEKEIGEDTSFFYTDTLFDEYTFLDSASTTLHSVDVYIDGICYDREGGVFYYLADGIYYPVQWVDIDLKFTEPDGLEKTFRYNLRYDFKRQMYENLNITNADKESGEEEQESASINESVKETSVNGNTTYTPYTTLIGDDVAMIMGSFFLNPSYLRLNILDETEQNWSAWSTIVLDGIDYNMSEIYYLEDNAVSPQVLSDTENYIIKDRNVLRIYENSKTYWVVSILPESVGRGWNGDMFVQANSLVNLMYGLRYSIYAVILVSFAICIFLFIFLVSAAGHRKKTEVIVETWMDKIPFDIYTGFVCVTEGFLLMLLMEVGYVYSSFAGLLMPMAVVLLCMFWLALLAILSFAVRVKTGRWWKNTVICLILSWICKGLRMILNHIPLLWKAILAMGIISLIEFLILALGSYGRGEAYFLWFFEKLILVPLILWGILQMRVLQEGGRKIAQGDLEHQIDTNKMFWEFKKHGEYLNSIGIGMSKAVDERIKSERFKTELITNVSHDIKTPLTSIINYVDLLQKENLENETVEEYLEVLDRQTGRLKKLIEDLMEASKASTGNLTVNLERLEAGVFMVQTVGEFEEKTNASGLELLITKPEKSVYIMADGRHFWRVIDNLMNNICKYAQPSTRVYINMEEKDQRVIITFRNTSKYALNITSEELMERFVRGDSSRNTEGSGLGLSIAKSLMELMGGTFDLYVDGDLFKVVLGFAETEKENPNH